MSGSRPRSFTIETRLLRWGDTSTAGRTVTLELDPNAGDHHPFKGLGIGKGGQRFRMTFTPISDDETTPAPAADRSFRAKQIYAESDDGTQAVTRAALLCRDTMFQAWAFLRFVSCNSPNEEDVAKGLRAMLGVKSRSEIATDPKALAAFLKLEREYRDFVQYGEMPR